MCIANSMEDYHSGKLAKKIFPRMSLLHKVLAKNGRKMVKKGPKMTKKNLAQKFRFFCYRDLALAVSVVLPPWEAFLDFSFPSYGRFRGRTPPMWQKVFPPPCWHFASSEGYHHENGHNSEMKSRKMLPKVAKRPKRQGLGPCSKKPKFFGPKFFLVIFGPFWPFFGRFWPELYEGATFGEKIFLPVVQNGNPP